MVVMMMMMMIDKHANPLLTLTAAEEKVSVRQ